MKTSAQTKILSIESYNDAVVYIEKLTAPLSHSDRVKIFDLLTDYARFRSSEASSIQDLQDSAEPDDQDC